MDLIVPFEIVHIQHKQGKPALSLDRMVKDLQQSGCKKSAAPGTCQGIVVSKLIKQLILVKNPLPIPKGQPVKIGSEKDKHDGSGIHHQQIEPAAIIIRSGRLKHWHQNHQQHLRSTICYQSLWRL